MPQNAFVRHRCKPSQMNEIFLEAPFSVQALVLVRPEPVHYSHHPFLFAVVSSVQSPNSQARFQLEQAFSLFPDFI
jgi:hypothetical protein